MPHPFVSRSELKAYCDGYRERGYDIVMTSGCFDILHCGHIELIRECWLKGHVVVVGLNSDESIRRLKGNGRPLNLQGDRGRVLRALHGVTFVALIEEDTPCELIRVVRPTIYMKGGDYDPAELVEEPTVLSHGGIVLRGPLVPGRSTTDLARRLAASAGILEG